jgi:hypothetical protein
MTRLGSRHTCARWGRSGKEVKKLPLVDMMFHSDSLDPPSKGFQLVHTTAIVGRPAETC